MDGGMRFSSSGMAVQKMIQVEQKSGEKSQNEKKQANSIRPLETSSDSRFLGCLDEDPDDPVCSHGWASR